MMYVLWRSQCRWALECRQAGERQRFTAVLDCWTAGLLDTFGACLDEKTKSELTGGMCGAAVLGHNGRMDALHCTVDGCDAVRCGAVRKGRGETRRETGETRQTHETHETHETMVAGRPAWNCFRVAAPVHRPFHRPSRKRLE